MHRAAFNRAFRDAGLSWHWDRSLYGQLLAVTGGKERLRHFIDAHAIDLGGKDTAATIAALHAAKTARYTELVDGGALRFRPGVSLLLEQARRVGVRLAIASTTSLPNIEALLRRELGAHSDRTFEVIATGDSVERKKPAPDIYLSALLQLQLPPAACLALEDSQPGLRSALDAGLATLVVRSTCTREQDFSGAALIVDSLEELPDRLGASGLLEALQRLHALHRAP